MSRSGKIAKNTGFLFFRSMFILLISLYTSRVLLRVLGVSDYGLFCVVGGVISMLGFLNQTMQSTYQRYLNTEMGKGNEEGVRKMFCLSLSSQLLLVLVVIFIAETVGLWFVTEKLVIPEGRMEAALWIYQAAIASFVLTLMSAPFGAAVIAHEKMGVFAVISVADALLRLAIVCVVGLTSGDALITYAYLLLLVGVMHFLMYVTYCMVKLPVVRLRFLWNRDELKNMLSFSGWSMFDALAQTLKSQGLNILLNLFFGTVVNAARGISYQILTGVQQFIRSFQTSFRPQLTKSYASGDYDYMMRLYYSATKISFYLIFTMSLPIMLETDKLLHIWLGDNVPEHTIEFTRLVLATAFVSAFANPTSCIAFATGKIKWFSILVAGTNILVLPLAYLVLRFGGSPAAVFWVSLLMTLLVQVIRINVVARMTVLKLKDYVKRVVLPLSAYMLLSAALPLLVVMTMDQTLWRFLLTCFVSVISCTVVMYSIGFNAEERSFALAKAKPLQAKIRRSRK